MSAQYGVPEDPRQITRLQDSLADCRAQQLSLDFADVIPRQSLDELDLARKGMERDP
jgi:hypothetical protein